MAVATELLASRAEAVSSDLQSDTFRGLTAAQAHARLKADGYNELPRPDKRTPFSIVIEVIREPMLLLLLGAGRFI